MPDESTKRKPRWRKWVIGSLATLGGFVAGFAGYVAWAVGPQLCNVTSEYRTAGVVREVKAFVTKTDGQWPRSWADLGDEDSSSYTRVDFSLDPATATKEDVLSSIGPLSGKYYTYPYAQRDLEDLYEELKAATAARTPSSPPSVGEVR